MLSLELHVALDTGISWFLAIKIVKRVNCETL